MPHIGLSVYRVIGWLSVPRHDDDGDGDGDSGRTAMGQGTSEVRERCEGVSGASGLNTASRGRSGVRLREGRAHPRSTLRVFV